MNKNMITTEEKLLKKIFELELEIKKIEKQKRYGLVWENKVEKFDKDSKDSLPILIEKGGKYSDIVTDKNKDFNILIEGDNYHSLSILSYTHKNKIDVIYIDPPYNTGNKDFIYNDHFVDKEDRFRHSKWLSFLNKRLKIAKILLKKEGVIFISIDDNEQANLKLLCDSILGEDNFIEQIIWKKRATPPNDRVIGRNHEYILCYGKSENYELNLLPRSESSLGRYSNPDNDPNGPWSSADLSANGKGGRLVKSCVFEIKNKITGASYFPPKDKCWLYNQEKVNKFIEEGRISFRKSGAPFLKRYLNEVRDGQTTPTIWLDAGFSQDSAEEIKNLFNGENIFENPKPVTLVKRLLMVGTKNKNATVLDFFAGSGTTGQAILELNKEDGGARKFILCTNNGDEKSEHKIAEDICYPRLQKIIKGYDNLKKEKVEGLGGNLKYLKTDFVKLEKSIDSLKHKVVEGSTEIICLKEGSFNAVLDNYKKNKIKVFKSTTRYTAILFDLFYFDDFIAELKKLKDKPVSVYVFSYAKDFSKEEFGNLGIRFTVEAIPEKILETYKKIFNF